MKRFTLAIGIALLALWIVFNVHEMAQRARVQTAAQLP
jgi:hypothetical protein